MIIRFFKFIGRCIASAFRIIGHVIVQTVSNAEAVVILGCASIGVAAILAELPFIVAVPMWMESVLVIPVIATSFIILLAWIMERRLSCSEA